MLELNINFKIGYIDFIVFYAKMNNMEWSSQC